MNTPCRGTLLRVFLGESDMLGGKPLYEEIVVRAKARGMAGASVLKGVIGFGKNSRMHTSHLLDLSTNLPVVVEMVDTEERIKEFLPELLPIANGGLVTLERLDVVQYGSGQPGEDAR